MEAWSPLMQGQLLDNEKLQEIAEKHGKTTAQVILRWDASKWSNHYSKINERTPHYCKCRYI